MDEDSIDAFMKKHKNLLKDLADATVCPKCRKIVRGDKFNLGKKFHWAEGCKICSESEEE